MPPENNVVLIGFMGSGKSAIGRRIARRLQREFCDTDKLVTEKANLSIPEIFTRFGEAHFRNLETEALESLLDRSGLVIATGGGIVLSEKNRALLRRIGCVAWLTASEDATFARVSRNRNRPLLCTEDPLLTIRRLLAEREPFYQETAHFRIDTTLRSPSQVTALVIAEARPFLQGLGSGS